MPAQNGGISGLALAPGFLSSRVRADELGCDSAPCYALAQRFYGINPVSADKALVVLAAALFIAVAYLVYVLIKTWRVTAATAMAGEAPQSERGAFASRAITRLSSARTRVNLPFLYPTRVPSYPEM